MSVSSLSSSLYENSAASTTSSALNFRAFSSLDLSEDQRKQIRSIVKSALDNGTSPDDVSSQIDAVLTPAQQTQLAQTVSANASSATNSTSSTTGSANVAAFQGPPPGRHHGPPPPSNASNSTTADTNTNPFTALNLTTSQQTAIAQILAEIQSDPSTNAASSSSANESSSSNVKSQIDQVLTATQQATLSAEFNAGFHQSSSIGTSTSAGLSNVQDQIAASNILNSLQLQSELT